MSKQYLELWSGKIPLSDVNWTFLEHKKFDFSNEFLKDKNSYWRKYILQFAQLYDGDLLFLDDFSVEGKRMELTTRSIKFSTLTYMISKNIKLSESLGSLGFQLFVCDPKGEKFLLGERSQSSEYKPGHYTIPGGMFEVEDSIDSVANACLREIKEELYLDLDPNTLFLTAILRELNDLGIVLLLECSLDRKIHAPILVQEKLAANEEWEGSYVYWFPFNSINELDQALLMEGLVYKLEKSNRNGD